MTATSDGSEKGSQKQKVVARLLCSVSQSHGLVDNLVKMRLLQQTGCQLHNEKGRDRVPYKYLQHELVLLGKESDRSKHEFEELEVEVGLIHIGPHAIHSLSI